MSDREFTDITADRRAASRLLTTLRTGSPARVGMSLITRRGKASAPVRPEPAIESEPYR